MITPSLTTLEKAVAARIYFENLYFPLLRQPNFREQRRLAMERDMTDMTLTSDQKDHLRERWRQNETDYLRECRRKLDASAFVKLETIGHGKTLWLFFPVHYLTISFNLSRCFWGCFPREREIHWKSIRHETGNQFFIICHG
jgi:hypothetical protein